MACEVHHDDPTFLRAPVPAWDTRPGQEAMDDVFRRLARSPFRARFKLSPRERNYLRTHGIQLVREHAARFISARLAPALPEKDGRQTPLGNHPVFIAQHATATCCRKCLEKWHGIPRGVALSPDQQQYVVDVIDRWIHVTGGVDLTAAPDQPRLF